MTKEERLAELIDQGSMIGYVGPSVLAPVSYHELWPEMPAMFFVELYGQAHLLHYGQFRTSGEHVSFFDEDGALIATVAPYLEWPEIEENLSVYLVEWRNWKVNPQREQMIEHFKETAATWRPGFQR